MSQVTMSGVVAGQQNKVGTASAVTSIAVSELTFRATEDLGGGLKASGFFTIENMNNRGTNTSGSENASGDDDDGEKHTHTVTKGPTNANSGISLSGGFGTVALNSTRGGNMAASANVFGASISKGFYDSVASRGPIQSLSYTSPALVPGLRATLAQALVGSTAASQAAKITVLAVNYAAGPVALGVQNKSLNAAAAAPGTEKSQTEAFVRYNAGVAVIGLGYGSKRTTTDKAVSTYGLSFPMGAITLGIEGGKRDAAEFTNFGARYALSKRTTVHISSGKFQTTAANSQNQSRIRLAHAF